METEESIIQKNWRLVPYITDLMHNRYRGLLDRDTVESDVSYGLFKAARKYGNTDRTFSTVACRSMINAVIDSARKQSLERRGTSRIVQMLEDPEQEVNRCYSIYEDIRDLLTWNERILLRLIYWEGYNITEAGMVMGRCRSYGCTTIKSIVDRIRRCEEVLIC